MFGMTGGVNGILKTNPRYFRVFYNPLWCKDIYGGREIFKQDLPKLKIIFINLMKTMESQKKKLNMVCLWPLDFNIIQKVVVF